MFPNQFHERAFILRPTSICRSHAGAGNLIGFSASTFSGEKGQRNVSSSTFRVKLKYLFFCTEWRAAQQAKHNEMPIALQSDSHVDFFFCFSLLLRERSLIKLSLIKTLCENRLSLIAKADTMRHAVVVCKLMDDPSSTFYYPPNGSL